MEIEKITGTIVIKEGKILLIKRKHGPFKNTWCSPGGFVEKMESIENCALRETKKETNINVEIIKKIEILNRHDKIKKRNKQIHIFLCKPRSDKIIVDNEISDAGWFNLNELNNLDLIPGFGEVISKHEDFLNLYKN